MKRIGQILKLAVLSTILIVGCSKDDDAPRVNGKVIEPITTDLTIDTFTDAINLQAEAGDRFIQELNTIPTAGEAVYNTAVWLHQQAMVDEVTVHGEYAIEVEFDTGLKTSLLLIAEGDSTTLRFRGGSPSKISKTSTTRIKEYSSSKVEKKIIENRNVLLFNTFESEFYHNDYPIQLFENSIVPLNVTKYANEEANLFRLREFTDKGLIIINTHGGLGLFLVAGQLNNTPLGQLTPNVVEDIFLEVDGIGLENYANQELIPAHTLRYSNNGEIASIVNESRGIGVTPGYVSGLQLDETMVFLNFCYSGDQQSGPDKNLVQAFLAAGAKSVFAYADNLGESFPVEQGAAIEIEKIFIRNLVQNGELSGVSNQANPPDGTPIFVPNYHIGKELEYYLVYTVKSKEDGTYESYSQLLEVNQDGRPIRRIKDTHPLYLWHDGDPEYTYKEGCLLDSNSGKTTDCGPFYIEPNGETLEGDQSLTLSLKHKDGDVGIPNEDYDYRIEWSTSAKHGQFDEEGASATIINSDSITYSCTDSESVNGVEEVQASIYIKEKNADDEEYELVNTTDAVINIKNIPECNSEEYDLEKEFLYDPVLDCNGDGSIDPSYGGYIIVTVQKDEDAINYRVDWNEVFLPSVPRYYNFASVSWTNDGDLPSTVTDNGDSFRIYSGLGNGATCASNSGVPDMEAAINSVTGYATVTICK